MLVIAASAQIPTPSPQSSPSPAPQTPNDATRKVNERPGDAAATPAEPFDRATTDKMAAQCVTLETEAGPIRIEMMPFALTAPSLHSV
jgi:hypothetical protein